MQGKLKYLFCIALALISLSVLAQNGSSIENKNIDWNAFDKGSTIPINKIKPKDIQGYWKAYKGVYQFDNYINAMVLTNPFIFEAKGNTERRSDSGTFEKFILKDNLIIEREEKEMDTGIINRITPTELTISWKNGSNFTRYYYKK